MAPKVRQLTDTECAALAETAARTGPHDSERIENRAYDLAQRAAAAGGEDLEQTFRFVARVFSPPIRALENVDPDNEFWVAPESMNDAEVDVLKHVWSINDDEIRARVGDHLWIRLRERQYAEGAIDAYLAIATACRDAQEWLTSAERYARAVALALMLGRKNERYRRAITAIDEYLRELDVTDPLFMSIRLMEVLLDVREGDPVYYATLAEKGACAAEGRQRFDIAGQYWTLARRWHEAAGDSDAIRRMRIAAAECVVADAASRIERGTSGYLVAASLLQAGIVMLKKIGGTQERIAALLPILRDYEQRGQAEFKPIRAATDVTKWVAASRAHVAGLPLPEAITALTQLIHLPNPEDLRDQVLTTARTFFSSSLPVTIVNAGGAAIAGTQGITGNEAADSNPVLAHMHKDAVRMFAVSGYADIEAARRQIVDEHDVRLDDLLAIVERSWFVPPSRELLFAKGLTAGFAGDFVTALHLLIPQMEAAIRYCLDSQGVVTTTFDREGYQKLRDLNQLLPMPETRTLLGARLQFALHALLTSSVGGNLRNKLAHGLLEPPEMSSTLAAFFLGSRALDLLSSRPHR